MHHIPSYPSIYNLGHKAIQDIFSGETEISEKIDGSSFSFCKTGGEYSARSKGKDLILDAPEKMFSKAVDVIKTLDLRDGWIYRGEYLSSPKHNTLSYYRVPKNHIIIYNIEISSNNFLSYEDMVIESNRIGLETVPLIYRGEVDTFDIFKEFLEKESILGGVNIEGVIIKNYNLFTADKKTMMAKYVSEQFKEKNSVEWKKSNPTQLDILQKLILQYKTDARILKTIQHLKEDGKLTDSLKDIGNLIKEYQIDLKKEEEDNIKQELFDYFWPKISMATTCKIPEYYKQYLAKQNFEVK